MIKIASLMGLLLCVSNLASAKTPTYKSHFDFPNPNGCIAYDQIVTNCNPAIAEKNCLDAQSVVDQIGKQLPTLKLKSVCYAPDALGYLQSTLISSNGSSGYRLSLKASPPGNIKTDARALTADPVACNAAAEVLRGLGVGDNLKVIANCDSSGLSASFQY